MVYYLCYEKTFSFLKGATALPLPPSIPFLLWTALVTVLNILLGFMQLPFWDRYILKVILSNSLRYKLINDPIYNFLQSSYSNFNLFIKYHPLKSCRTYNFRLDPLLHVNNTP